MENEEGPIQLDDYRPIPGPEGPPPPPDAPQAQQIDANMLFQMIGEREVQLYILRANLATLRATVERLATRKPTRGGFGTEPVPVPEPEDSPG